MWLCRILESMATVTEHHPLTLSPPPLSRFFYLLPLPPPSPPPGITKVRTDIIHLPLLLSIPRVVYLSGILVLRTLNFVEIFAFLINFVLFAASKFRSPTLALFMLFLSNRYCSNLQTLPLNILVF